MYTYKQSRENKINNEINKQPVKNKTNIRRMEDNEENKVKSILRKQREEKQGKEDKET
jgi:hypothetical protein